MLMNVRQSIFPSFRFQFHTLRKDNYRPVSRDTEGLRRYTFAFIVNADAPVKCSPWGINIQMSHILFRDGS